MTGPARHAPAAALLGCGACRSANRRLRSSRSYRHPASRLACAAPEREEPTLFPQRLGKPGAPPSPHLVAPRRPAYAGGRYGAGSARTTQSRRVAGLPGAPGGAPRAPEAHCSNTWRLGVRQQRQRQCGTGGGVAAGGTVRLAAAATRGVRSPLHSACQQQQRQQRGRHPRAAAVQQQRRQPTAAATKRPADGGRRRLALRLGRRAAGGAACGSSCASWRRP